jgi:hypothetical protein
VPKFTTQLSAYIHTGAGRRIAADLQSRNNDDDSDDDEDDGNLLFIVQDTVYQ